MTQLADYRVAGEQRAAECMALLASLAGIESPTGDEEASLRIAATLEDALAQAGGIVERVPAPGMGTHLVARFPGPSSPSVTSSSSSSSDPSRSSSSSATSGDRADAPLLVVGHMDTVHPKGTLARFPFSEGDGKVRGPGVYDMKAGLAVSISALRILAEEGAPPRRGLSFLATCDEEVGSPTSRTLVENEARRSRAALVMEPCVPGGAAKTRRKGVADYVLTVAGKAAHAGIEPDKGASAVHEIARQIGRVASLADAARGTTVNVGVISGGTRGNVVADAARCSIDARFWETEEGRRVDAGLRSLEPANKKCSLRLEGGLNRGALEKTPASARLFAKARALADGLGIDLAEGETGGGSDGNLTAAAGCPTLDGLGPDGGGAHTLHEHVLAEDVPRRIALMAALFATL